MHSSGMVPSLSDYNSNFSGHKLYDPSSSSTSSDVGEPFSHQYGDGSAVSGEQLLRRLGAATNYSTYLAKSGSELYIGETNQKHYTGTFTYMPVTTQVGIQDDDDAFGFSFDGISVNGKTVAGREGAIIDTAQVVGDARSIQAIYAQIPGSKDAGDGTNRLIDVWEVPCDSNTPISITFSGTAFGISASTFNLELPARERLNWWLWRVRRSW
ncbi:aspartic peptidase domain-containing protein [Lactarius deliciosus]|nr:aspartic peptidase domain-containing protein [Lactarius deliciosus]